MDILLQTMAATTFGKTSMEYKFAGHYCSLVNWEFDEGWSQVNKCICHVCYGSADWYLCNIAATSDNPLKTACSIELQCSQNLHLQWHGTWASSRSSEFWIQQSVVILIWNLRSFVNRAPDITDATVLTCQDTDTDVGPSTHAHWIECSDNVKTNS